MTVADDPEDDDDVRGAIEAPSQRRMSSRQLRGSSVANGRSVAPSPRRRAMIAVGAIALLLVSLAGAVMLVTRPDPVAGVRYAGLLPSWFSGKDDAPPTPLPTVEPLELMDVTPQTARQLNAAVPFVTGPSVAARPFRFAGTPQDRDAARMCLAAAVYYEAGDSAIDQYAVAQVVLNRARHPAFPKTICGVVFQGAERSTGCQFTFACDGTLSRRRPSAGAWTRALSTADAALSGFVFTLVGTATHYHTDWVFPYWQSKLDKIAQLHTHIFYRWPGWWGTLAAFSGAVGGPEHVDPRVVAFAGADNVANLPTVEAPPETPPDAAPAKPVATATPAPVKIPGISPSILKGNVAFLVNDTIDVVVLKLDPEAFSGSFAVVAHAICGERSTCLVAGYVSEDQLPKALPLGADALARADFLYRRAAGSDGAEMLWNCAKFPRKSAKECRAS